MALEPGAQAPDFSLHSTPDQSVALRDFRGRRLVLTFHPADWSPVCTDQLAVCNELLPEFRRLGAELLGLSVDGVCCHLAFAKTASCASRCSPISSPRAMLREQGA